MGIYKLPMGLIKFQVGFIPKNYMLCAANYPILYRIANHKLSRTAWK